jgi:dihydrodipicolinate synthase/N-acetylneuraminate lyase
MATLAGVLPVIQTPFDNDETIDVAALHHELHWVLDQGVAGVTTGMVSEVLRLSESERRHLTEVVVGVARERGALSVVSCGSESTAGALAYARHAEAVGADAVMVIPPVTVALGDEALYGYFADIAEATSLGLVVQDASGYVGRPLSLDVQARLHATYPERVVFKPEALPIGQRFSALRDATGGRARILEGTGGAALVDTFGRGAVGTMPGAEVCWAVQRLWEHLVAGDTVAADAIAGPLAMMVGLQTSLDAFVAVEKHLLVAQGVIPSARARGPLGYVLDAETRAEVNRLCDVLRAAATR